MIELDIEGDERLIDQLNRMQPEQVASAVRAAAKRAATAARLAGVKEIRAVYTMKSGDIKNRAQIKNETDGASIQVKGSMEPVKKYRAALRRQGVFVSIKKGMSTVVPRSFQQGGRFLARRGQARYPIKGLYGPSVPQLFGNAQVMQAIEARGNEVFETRLYHEIERLMGG